MAKKPKEEWQISIRTELDRRGMSYDDLAHEMGEPEGTIRQLMRRNDMPLLKEKVLKYLGIEIKE